MDRYKTELVNSVSKLDAITDSCGKMTKLASLIVEENCKTATKTLLIKISEVMDNPEYKVEIKRVAQLVNSKLIEYYGYVTLQNICKSEVELPEDTRSLEELIFRPLFFYETRSFSWNISALHASAPGSSGTNCAEC